MGSAQMALQPVKKLRHAQFKPGGVWPDHVRREDIIHIEHERHLGGTLLIWWLVDDLIDVDDSEHDERVKKILRGEEAAAYGRDIITRALEDTPE